MCLIKDQEKKSQYKQLYDKQKWIILFKFRWNFICKKADKIDFFSLPFPFFFSVCEKRNANRREINQFMWISGERQKISTLSFCSSWAFASVCAFLRISSMNTPISSMFCGSSQNSAIRTFNGIWLGLDKSKLICRIFRWASSSMGFTSKSNFVLSKLQLHKSKIIIKMLLFQQSSQCSLLFPCFFCHPPLISANRFQSAQFKVALPSLLETQVFSREGKIRLWWFIFNQQAVLLAVQSVFNKIVRIVIYR